MYNTQKIESRYSEIQKLIIQIIFHFLQWVLTDMNIVLMHKALNGPLVTLHPSGKVRMHLPKGKENHFEFAKSFKFCKSLRLYNVTHISQYCQAQKSFRSHESLHNE